MIQVQYMKPFYTRVIGSTLRLVFAYQYFSIRKDNELYHFVPTEGKEININLVTKKIENLSEIFVFQKGKRIIKLQVNQLLLISNLHEHIKPILATFSVEATEVLKNGPPKSDIDRLIQDLEIQNFNNLIDETLTKRDQQMFYQLVQNRAFLLEDYSLEA